MIFVGLLIGLFFGRDYLMGLFVVIFPFFGYMNGFVAARFYSFFKGSSWLTLAWVSAVAYPTFILLIYSMIVYLDPTLAEKITGTTLSSLTIAYLWYFVNLPSTAFGAVTGFVQKIGIPTKLNRVSREIPE